VPPRLVETEPPGLVVAPDRPEETDRPEVVVRDARDTIRSSVAHAWAERHLAPRLGVRVLVKRIAGTKLGLSWLVIRPLMETVGMTLLFGGLLQVPAPGPVPYFLFVLAGLTGWRLFERTVFFQTRSFDLYRKMMKEVAFPLLLIPLAAAAFPALEIAVYLLVFVVSMLVFLFVDGQLYLQLDTVALVAGFGLIITSALGLGLWTSVLNAKARDVRLGIRYVLQFWLFLTPVVYPLSALPKAYEWVAAVNPMTAPIELVKSGLLNVGNVRPDDLLLSVCFAAVMLLSGLWFYARQARRSIDVLGELEEGE
jgi:lipopolysaccharide transport system permease protein